MSALARAIAARTGAALPAQSQEQILDRLIDSISTSSSKLTQQLLTQLDADYINRSHSTSHLSPLETLLARYPRLVEADLAILDSLFDKGADLGKVDNDILNAMMEVDSDAQGLDGSVKEFEAKLIQKFADMNQPSSGGEGEIQIDAEMEQPQAPSPLAPRQASPQYSYEAQDNDSRSTSIPPADPIQSRLSRSPRSVSPSFPHRRSRSPFSREPSRSAVVPAPRPVDPSAPAPLAPRRPPPPTSTELVRLFVPLPRETSVASLYYYFSTYLRVRISDIVLRLETTPHHGLFNVEKEVFESGELERRFSQAVKDGTPFKDRAGNAWSLKARMAKENMIQGPGGGGGGGMPDPRRQSYGNEDRGGYNSHSHSHSHSNSFSMPAPRPTSHHGHRRPSHSPPPRPNQISYPIPTSKELVRLFVPLPRDTSLSSISYYFGQILQVKVYNIVLYYEKNPSCALIDVEKEVFESGDLDRRFHEAEEAGRPFRLKSGDTWKLKARQFKAQGEGWISLTLSGFSPETDPSSVESILSNMLSYWKDFTVNRGAGFEPAQSCHFKVRGEKAAVRVESEFSTFAFGGNIIKVTRDEPQQDGSMDVDDLGVKKEEMDFDNNNGGGENGGYRKRYRSRSRERDSSRRYEERSSRRYEEGDGTSDRMRSRSPERKRRYREEDAGRERRSGREDDGSRHYEEGEDSHSSRRRKEDYYHSSRHSASPSPSRRSRYRSRSRSPAYESQGHSSSRSGEKIKTSMEPPRGPRSSTYHSHQHGTNHFDASRKHHYGNSSSELQTTSYDSSSQRYN